MNDGIVSRELELTAFLYRSLNRFHVQWGHFGFGPPSWCLSIYAILLQDVVSFSLHGVVLGLERALIKLAVEGLAMVRRIAMEHLDIIVQLNLLSDGLY